MKRTYGKKNQKRIFRDASSDSDVEETAPVSLPPVAKAHLVGNHDASSPPARKRSKIELEHSNKVADTPPKPAGTLMAAGKPCPPSGSGKQQLPRLTPLATSKLPAFRTALPHVSSISLSEAQHSPVGDIHRSKSTLKDKRQPNKAVSQRQKHAGAIETPARTNTDVESSDEIALTPESASRASPSKPIRTYSSRSSRNSNASPSTPSKPLAALPPSILHRSSTLPSTPTVVRDLSSILDLSTGSSLTKPHARPPMAARASSGVISRMLGRARTENSVLEAEENMLPAVSPPIARSPSISSLLGTPKEANSRPSSLEPELSKPPLVSLSTKHARTYADASRTFLVALPAASARATRLLQSTSNSMMIDEDAKEDTVSQVENILDDIADDPDAMRESYTALRTRYGVDLSEDDPSTFPPPEELSDSVQDSPDPSPSKKARALRRTGSGTSSSRSVIELLPQPYNALKSITEMRSKGESRRFMDEMGYLFEGLEEGAAIGVKRGSALEVTGKLCNEEFAHKAKTGDFLPQIWKLLRGAGAGDGDKILDLTLIIFAALIAREPRDLAELAEKTDLPSTMIKLLSSYPREKDIFAIAASGGDEARLKTAGVLRGDKAHLTALVNLVKLNSGLWPENGLAYVSTMVLTTLSNLAPSLLPVSSAKTLVTALVGELRLVPPRLTAYAAGLSLVSTASPNNMPCWDLLENALRLFDSYLLGQWPNNQEDDSQSSQDEVLDEVLGAPHKQDELMNGLVALCIAADLCTRSPNEEAEAAETLRSCLASAFRVLVNLSHSSTDWSLRILANPRTLPMVMRCIASASSFTTKKDSRSDLISPAIEDEWDTQSFDRLCLALALLTNLVQGADEAKDFVRDCLVSSSCHPGRSCIDGPCNCPSRKSAFFALTSTYTRYTKADFDDASAVFIRGHLAVLFSILMHNSHRNQEQLLAALRGSSHKAKVGGLVEHAEAFVSFYAKLNKADKSRRAEESERSDTASQALDFLHELKNTPHAG